MLKPTLIPCPCRGCHSGTHDDGQTCGFCAGRGQFERGYAGGICTYRLHRATGEEAPPAFRPRSGRGVDIRTHPDWFDLLREQIERGLPRYADTQGSATQRLSHLLQSMGDVNDALADAYAKEDWQTLDYFLSTLWKAQPALWAALDAVFGPEWPRLIKVDLDFWSDTLAGNCVAEGIDTALT